MRALNNGVYIDKNLQLYYDKNGKGSTNSLFEGKSMDIEYSE